MIIKNSDYKNHYKLNDYFEVEYVDELVRYADNLNNVINEFNDWLEECWQHTNDIWYVKIINKLKEIKEKHSDKGATN